MTTVTRLRAPLTDEQILPLKAGDAVLIDGTVFGARDAAHAQLVEALRRGEVLPIELTGQILYYVGPAPARPGHPIGSAGPTTSGRMDRYTPELLAAGLRATIGKGHRGGAVRESIVAHRCLYLAAIGGSGAMLAKRIIGSEVVAYEELGPEAIYRFEVRDFPAVVVNDAHGLDLYEMSREEYCERA
ncbi:MAG TPA: Fe-S-containing hydro-lyase [Thermomicrobiales bacterium]|nr:Fe-S-containing hydro-lyase [Thermomicrobiales bacterium]